MKLLQAFEQTIKTKLVNGTYTEQMAHIARTRFAVKHPDAPSTEYDSKNKDALQSFFKALKKTAAHALQLHRREIPLHCNASGQMVFHGTLLAPEHVFNHGIKNTYSKALDIETSEYLAGTPAERRRYVAEQMTRRKHSYPDPKSTSTSMLHAGENTGLISCSVVAREAARHALKARIHVFYTTQFDPNTLEKLTKGCPAADAGGEHAIVGWVYAVAPYAWANVSADLQWTEGLPDGCNEYEVAVPGDVQPETVIAAYPVWLPRQGDGRQPHEVMLGEPMLQQQNRPNITDLVTLHERIHDPALKVTSYPSPAAKIGAAAEGDAALALMHHPTLMQFIAAYGASDQAALTACKAPHKEAQALCMNLRPLDRRDYLAKHYNDLHSFYKKDDNYHASEPILARLLDKYLSAGANMMCCMRVSKEDEHSHLVDAIISVSMTINLAELSNYLQKLCIGYHLNQQPDGTKQVVITAINQSDNDPDGPAQGNGDNILRSTDVIVI